eukprot:5992057-Karenia_brevis.AAC.1
MVWRQAAARRWDMRGLDAGVDRAATQALLHSANLSAYELGMLRAIISGAVWTQDRAFRAKQTDTDLCSFCGLEREDQEHMWWRC